MGENRKIIQTDRKMCQKSENLERYGSVTWKRGKEGFIKGFWLSVWVIGSMRDIIAALNGLTSIDISRL